MASYTGKRLAAPLSCALVVGSRVVILFGNVFPNVRGV